MRCLSENTVLGGISQKEHFLSVLYINLDFN